MGKEDSKDSSKEEKKAKSKPMGMSPGESRARYGSSQFAGMTESEADTASKAQSSTAKEQEFTGAGSKYTGTAKMNPYKELGASPGDVNAIVGSYESAEYKSKLEGIAGITSKNLGQLQQRAQVGQFDTSIDTPIGKIPAGVTSIGMNVLGKKMAKTIMDNIAAGDSAVFSTKGDIVGSVGKNALGMNVYTGQSAYSPIGRTTGVKRLGSGYISSRDFSGREGGGEDSATTSAAAPSEPTTAASAPATGLSSAAKKSLQAARTAGAARRKFIV